MTTSLSRGTATQCCVVETFPLPSMAAPLPGAVTTREKPFIPPMSLISLVFTSAPTALCSACALCSMSTFGFSGLPGRCTNATIEATLSGDQAQQMSPGRLNLVGSPCCQPCGGAKEMPISSGLTIFGAAGAGAAGGGVACSGGGVACAGG